MVQSYEPVFAIELLLPSRRSLKVRPWSELSENLTGDAGHHEQSDTPSNH
jgi:hypothetical protein